MDVDPTQLDSARLIIFSVAPTALLPPPAPAPLALALALPMPLPLRRGPLQYSTVQYSRRLGPEPEFGACLLACLPAVHFSHQSPSPFLMQTLTVRTRASQVTRSQTSHSLHLALPNHIGHTRSLRHLPPPPSPSSISDPLSFSQASASCTQIILCQPFAQAS